MKRLWQMAVNPEGKQSPLHAPFLLALNLITPVYQYFSRRHLEKRRKNRSKQWKARVISIGNITVGGSGKTPIVCNLAARFIDRGRKVAIVHSGYGRKTDTEIIIDYDRGSDCSIDVTGDEIAMMAGQIPRAGFAVGANKKKMVILADQKLNPDVIIIDDGYQRLDIEKNLDIVVVSEMTISAKNGNRGLRPFPRGILREPLSALNRADAIFITGIQNTAHDSNKAKARGHNPDAPVIAWDMSISGLEYDGEVKDINILNTLRPFLFAGIGSYPRLLSMIEKAGIEIVGDYCFDDHVSYGKAEIDKLSRLSNSAYADSYLTTAKDMVKLPPAGLDKPVYCLALSVRPDNEPRLDDIIGLDD